MESKGFKKQQQTEEDKDDVLNWNSAETAKRGAVSFTLSQSSHINNNGTILHVEKETEGDQPLRIECRMSHARPFQWILNQTEKQHQQKYNDTRRPLFCVTQSFQIDMQREEEAAAASNDDVEMEWWGIPVSLTHPTAVRQGIVSSFIEDAVDGEKAVVELVGVHGWVTLGAWLKEIGYKIGLEPKYGA